MIRFLEYFTEVLAWLGIVLSFIFLGALLGGVLYLIINDTAALIAGIIIALAGAVTGFYLAIKAWKTTGTVNCISGLSRNRQPDDIDEGIHK
jgi:disulfide bond formation protein DsbB